MPPIHHANTQHLNDPTLLTVNAQPGTVQRQHDTTQPAQPSTPANSRPWHSPPQLQEPCLNLLKPPKTKHKMGLDQLGRGGKISKIGKPRARAAVSRTKCQL